MRRGMDSFRSNWSNERLDGKRSDFHKEQQVHRRRAGDDGEQEDDWFFNAPSNEKAEEAESV